VSWALAFAGFAALIILHEAGHFAAAKAVGMRVERFFLFFPPKLWSVKRGETEYGVGAIPLGGFVKITGMNPDEELPPEVAPRGYYHQPVWKRIVVIAAGPFVNLVIAFVILFFLSFEVAEQTNEVESVRPGTPAAAVLEPGDRIVAVDGQRGDPEILRAEIASHE
jgi:regulator of sigma E protease